MTGIELGSITYHLDNSSSGRLANVIWYAAGPRRAPLNRSLQRTPQRTSPDQPRNLLSAWTVLVTWQLVLASDALLIVLALILFLIRVASALVAGLHAW